MGLISRAWTNLAPPGAILPPDDLTRPPEGSSYRKRAKRRLRKAARFDADWRFGGHHTDSYVSGSDMKNAVV